MKTATAYSTAVLASVAIREIAAALRERLGASPGWMVVHHTVKHDVGALREALRRELPGVPVHGASSCRGAMTAEGIVNLDGFSIAAFGLVDPGGSYGTGYADLGDDPALASQRAAETALARAGRDGELPTVLWISACPGREEKVIQGLESMFGPHVPVFGGSAADDECAGGWQVLTDDASGPNGVVVSALFCSRPVAFSFHSGYDPTREKACVTLASGRNVLELDGRPAADVYNAWVGSALADVIDQPGASVLARTTLNPLGRAVGSIGGVTHFQLSHPERITAGRGLAFFAELSVGDEVVVMRGSVESLVSRAGRVARSAIANGHGDPDQVAGGLIVYCAGCMLTVADRMIEVVHGVSEALHGRPFLGSFTFGEQGCFPGGQNRHGNLMISALVFFT